MNRVGDEVIYSITSMSLRLSYSWCTVLTRFCVSEQPGVLSQKYIARHSAGVAHIRASSGVLPRVSSRMPTALCDRVQKPESDKMNLQNKINVQNSFVVCA